MKATTRLTLAVLVVLVGAVAYAAGSVALACLATPALTVALMAAVPDGATKSE